MTKPLADLTELLLRQVHLDLFKEGRPSSSSFIPTKKDRRQLSVSLRSLATPEEAYKTYTLVHKKSSCGTWGVTVQECADLSLPAFPDPLVNPPDPAHGRIDFAGVPNQSQVEKKGMVLARKATARGQLFAPTAA